MAIIRVVKDNFNQGELGPFLLGRNDNPIYEAGAFTAENWMLLPQGGIIRRPGFQNIDGVGPLVPPPPPPPDSGPDGIGCTYRTPGETFLFDSFVGPSVDLALHLTSTHGWYHGAISALYSIFGQNNTSLDGLYSSSPYSSSRYWAKNPDAIVSGYVLTNNDPPNYGIFPIPSTFGLSVDVYPPTVLPVTYTASHATIFSYSSFTSLDISYPAGSTGLYFTSNNFLTYNAIVIDLLPDGHFYTCEFQVTLDSSSPGNWLTCHYLQRSTDGQFLVSIEEVLIDGNYIIRGIWSPIRSAIATGAGEGVELKGVYHLLTPLPGSQHDAPQSGVLIDVSSPFIAKNLRLYHI